MRALLLFLHKNASTLLFLLLEAAALFLLLTGNSYHQSVWFTSANAWSGKMYAFRHRVTGYLNLGQANDELWQRNSQLEQEVAGLRHELEQMGWEKSDTVAFAYDFVYGHVLRNSIYDLENTVLTDVGAADGVAVGMGVTSPVGIAGLVVACSEHYSIVASVLNVKMRFSCKIKGSQVTGPLSWDGKDIHYAYLSELPGYVSWHEGDTVVTSGFSESFAEGFPVGVIESFDKNEDSQFIKAKVRLFTQFETLSTLRLIRLVDEEEIHGLQNGRL